MCAGEGAGGVTSYMLLQPVQCGRDWESYVVLCHKMYPYVPFTSPHTGGGGTQGVGAYGLGRGDARLHTDETHTVYCSATIRQ